jgi:hypothetical protein
MQNNDPYRRLDFVVRTVAVHVGVDYQRRQILAMTSRMMRHMVWVLWFTLLALNVADVWTTSMVFDAGGHEANPLLGNDLAIIIILKLIVLTVIFLLLELNQDKQWVPYALLVAVVVYSVTVGVNVGGLVTA